MTTPNDHLSDPTSKATSSSMDTSHDEPATTGRRGFLKLGGLAVGVTAFAAACVQQVKTTEPMTQTGTIVPAPSTSEAPFTGSAEMDAELTLTALSLEKLIIDTYKQVDTSGWVTKAGAPAIIARLGAQHEDHVGDLETLARALGQDPSKVSANATVKADEVDPMVQTIQGEASDKEKVQVDAVTLLIDLEDTLGQLYNKAGGEGTTAQLRSQFTAMGGTEARHYAVLAGIIGRPPAPFALGHIAPAALTDEAWIAPNGPVRSSGSTGSTPGTTGS